MELRGFGRWVACSFAMLVAACSSPIVPPLPESPQSIARASKLASSRHLYVIVTTNSGFIAEYPIRNGIPAAKPDRTVTGFKAPNAIAVDAGGDLFVLDYTTVKEFAPAASGPAKPIREIDVPNFLNINTLAVDSRGYLYVGQKQRIYVYGPNAHGHTSPIAKIKPAGYPNGLALDGNNLYVAGDTQRMESSHLQYQLHATLYSAAPALRRIRGFCSPELPDSGINYGIALDGAGRLFTTHTYFINSYPSGEIDVYPADADGCPTEPSGEITTSDPVLREPVYVAVNRPFLYVGDVFYGGGGVVFTLRTTGSSQEPLSTLDVAGGGEHNIFGLALGP